MLLLFQVSVHSRCMQSLGLSVIILLLCGCCPQNVDAIECRAREHGPQRESGQASCEEDLLLCRQHMEHLIAETESCRSITIHQEHELKTLRRALQELQIRLIDRDGATYRVDSTASKPAVSQDRNGEEEKD